MSHITPVSQRLRRTPRSLAALLLFTALSSVHCGLVDPSGTAPAPASFELQLSPSNPQIAHGTAAQFSLRGLDPGGRLVDLTEQATWHVIPESADATQAVATGMVELTAPGRYRVIAEFEGQHRDTPLVVTAATLKSLAISPTAPRIAKGLTQPFTAKASFSDGTTQDVTATASWSVKDLTGTLVATISTKGVATAQNAGQARITARYLGQSAVATLVVTAATLQTLTLSPENPRIAQGTTQRFSATGTFSDGTSQDVASLVDWFVTDVTGTNVATSDSNGTVTGLQVGQAQVEASYPGHSVQTMLTVTPAVVVSLSVSPAAAAIAKGTAQKFTATARLTDGTTQDVTALSMWTSTDLLGSGVASVDASGQAKGQSAGRAQISCSYRGAVGSAALEVKPATLVSLNLSPATATVPKGLSQKYQLVGGYSDGSTQDVTDVAVWTVRDLSGTNVVSLDARGVAVGANLGQAQIQADYPGKSATATLTVEAPKLLSLTLEPAKSRIEVGEVLQLKVQGRYSDGTTQDLSALASYSVTDIAPGRGVANVSASGLVTGGSLGRATLAASHLGLRIETTLTVRAQALCSVDGWCWQNPLPQGNPLLAVWGSRSNNVFAVGQGGIIFRWDGTTWSPQRSGTRNSLYGVWGYDANNIWAVGDAGTILKWNGSAWSPQLSGSTSTLRGVWGSAANNVWAVGADGQILRWNGATWTPQPSGTANGLNRLWGSDANNVWVVGDKGTILKWNGMTWSPQPSGFSTNDLAGVWGSDKKNIWAVGERGLTLQWDGSTWNFVSGPFISTGGLLGVWGSDEGDVWAVGSSGTLFMWNGVKWSAVSSGSEKTLRAVWMATDTFDAWAVGDSGEILRGNRATWTAQSKENTSFLAGVWASDVNNAWAMGSAGKILKWNGTQWTAQPIATTVGLNVWGLDANNVWAFGGNGTILKRNGATWAAQASGSSMFVRGLWGSDANNVWAVGADGTILKWNGSAWSMQPSGTTNHLESVWGLDASNVWAVGRNGTILKWDGRSWAAQSSGVTSWLLSVHGTNQNNIWVSGGDGAILKFGGGSWQSQWTGTTTWLRSVCALDTKNVWAVGDQGTILKWDGVVTWTSQASGTTNRLQGVWGLDANNVWAVGDQGTILRLIP